MYTAIKLKLDKAGNFTVDTEEFADKTDAEFQALTILREATKTDDPVTTALVLNEYGAMIRRPESVKHEEEEAEITDETGGETPTEQLPEIRG